MTRHLSHDQQIRLRMGLFVFAGWQLEVCLIFHQLGWPTDILFIPLPNWVVVTFYLMLMFFIYLTEPRGGV